jgi:hypothetical protein
MQVVGIGEVMKSSGCCCPLVNSYHPRHLRKAEVVEPLVTFEGVSVVVPCTMKLRQEMRKHEALLYGRSTEVKKQTGAKGQKEELGLMTLIENDRALKPLALTCRRISCTHILLKE